MNYQYSTPASAPATSAGGNLVSTRTISSAFIALIFPCRAHCPVRCVHHILSRKRSNQQLVGFGQVECRKGPVGISTFFKGNVCSKTGQIRHSRVGRYCCSDKGQSMVGCRDPCVSLSLQSGAFFIWGLHDWWSPLDRGVLSHFQCRHLLKFLPTSTTTLR